MIFSSKSLSNNFIVSIILNSTYKYPSPLSLNYFYNFGIYALVFFFIQFISGIFLTMYYIPNINFAFSSVEYIMRDVELWLASSLYSFQWGIFFFFCYFIVILGEVSFFLLIRTRAKAYG
jgi:ubiquinol-cytochrome c reductase cytochrome b subunit